MLEARATCLLWRGLNYFGKLEMLRSNVMQAPEVTAVSERVDAAKFGGGVGVTRCQQGTARPLHSIPQLRPTAPWQTACCSQHVHLRPSPPTSNTHLPYVSLSCLVPRPRPR